LPSDEFAVSKSPGERFELDGFERELDAPECGCQLGDGYRSRPPALEGGELLEEGPAAVREMAAEAHNDAVGETIDVKTTTRAHKFGSISFLSRLKPALASTRWNRCLVHRLEFLAQRHPEHHNARSDPIEQFLGIEDRRDVDLGLREVLRRFLERTRTRQGQSAPFRLEILGAEKGTEVAPAKDRDNSDHF
jgi:hypothetical protein